MLLYMQLLFNVLLLAVKVETGDMQICCQIAVECTKSHIYFQNIFRSHTPNLVGYTVVSL